MGFDYISDGPPFQGIPAGAPALAADITNNQLYIGNPSAGSWSQVSGGAPLNSPAFTGVPTVNGNSLVPASEILEATGTISSAVLKTLTSTVGTQLIAAPGAGKTICPENVYFNYTFGTLAYTSGGTLQLKWNNNATAIFNLAGASYITTTSSTVFMSSIQLAAAAGASFVASTTINTPLFLGTNSANTFATGDGTLFWKVRYRIESAS